MKIIMNGKPENIAESLSIEGFLATREINPEQVVVEHNLSIIKRDQFSAIILADGDSLEILQFVGGG